MLNDYPFLTIMQYLNAMEDLDRDTILNIAWTSIKKHVIDSIDWLPNLNDLIDKYHEKRGVFTTIYTLETGEKRLRGCVGLPHPEEKLGHAIAISARRSISEDPRFPKVTTKDLNYLKIGVEVLSPIEQIRYLNFDDLVDKIELGIHGLLIDWRNFAGLLLPRVAIEMNWTKVDYIKNIVRKANLTEEHIFHPDTKLYRFTSKQYLQN